MPPTTTAARMPVPAAIKANASPIWSASSRVGLRTTALTPVPGLFFKSDSSMGRTKASVLPVPVCAVATTSWPASAGGIACDWTGVGSTKLCLRRLLFKIGERESSVNVFIQIWREESASRLPEGEKGLQINFDQPVV